MSLIGLVLALWLGPGNMAMVIKNMYVPVTAVYVVSAALWLPPVVMVVRSNDPGHWQRVLVIALATLSPAVALMGVGLGNDYCTGEIGIGGQGFVGTLWPNCPNAYVAWVIMLAPATLLGLLAWVGAISGRQRSRTTARPNRPEPHFE